MTFRAVVFDLDGTLINSLADIATATNRVLRAKQFPEHPLEAFRTLVGDGVRTLFERALPDTAEGSDTIVDECVADFKREYDQCWHEQSHLYEGIADALTQIADGGTPMSILSNKPHAFTVQCAEHFLSQWPLAMVLGQREAVPRKPDPAGALEIAEHLCEKPADCLYVGDSSVDMQTANAAGMFALGVSWGFRSREELIAHGAERVIDHPREMVW